MEKFIPYDKLSKKEKRRRDAMGRGTWGTLSPVTRKGPNPKAYKRENARKWMADPYFGSFFLSPVSLRERSPGKTGGSLYAVGSAPYFMKVPSIICCR